VARSIRDRNSICLVESDHSSLGTAEASLDSQRVPALPRTSRPTLGVEPECGAGQNGVISQSAESGQFLRVMRARMSPEAAGLPTTSEARRVLGLRREEVAQLAGVSTDYYTRLEQGRQILPTDRKRRPTC